MKGEVSEPNVAVEVDGFGGSRVKVCRGVSSLSWLLSGCPSRVG